MVITWQLFWLVVALILAVVFALIGFDVLTSDRPLGWLALVLIAALLSRLPVPARRRGGPNG